MKTKDQRLWDILFLLGPVKRKKPPATLYDVIVDTKDLQLVKNFVAGGHEINQQFMGGNSLALAVRHGNLDLVRYFIEHIAEMADDCTALTRAVERIAESTGQELEEAFGIFTYLLQQPLSQILLNGAYLKCAVEKQVTAAKLILAFGLEDQQIQYGYKKHCLLSDRIAYLGYSDFSALLKGDPVDEDRLLRQEKKTQISGEKSRRIRENLMPVENHCPLTSDELTRTYETFIDDLHKGEWDDCLLSYDPTPLRRGILEFAAENNFVEIAGIVLDKNPYGKKRSKVDSGKAAIAAATYGNLDMVKLLSEHGAEVAATPKNSNSPLSEACRYGHYDVVAYLLEAGADPRSGDGSGHEPTLIELAGGVARNRIIGELRRFMA